MHRKVIRGATYYYTTVRDNGKVKTIYLGRTRTEARKKEAQLKGVEIKTPRPRIHIGFPRAQVYLGLMLIIAVLLLSGVMTGNLTLGPAFRAENPLPGDIATEASAGRQASELAYEKSLENPGSELILKDDYSSETDLSGFGEGYGVRNEKVR